MKKVRLKGLKFEKYVCCPMCNGPNVKEAIPRHCNRCASDLQTVFKQPDIERKLKSKKILALPSM